MTKPESNPLLTDCERPKCEKRSQGELASLTVLIPAYQPNHTLVDFARKLTAAGFSSIVVINDGSGPACSPVFDALAQIEGVQIIEHVANLGKGAALKTGINYALGAYAGITGIVTADADGQHLPEDVLAVAEKLLESPTALVLGARGFSGSVPLRSRFGNSLTRKAVRMLVGAELQDTQTGLRGIPATFAALLLRLTSAGYDFELDMLIAARKDGLEILEQPIQTVYEPGNKSSHFNPLTDSMKIYFVLLRFSSVSLISALLDNVIFYIAYHHGWGILKAQMFARVTAAVFNYLLVRRAVFHVRERHTGSFPKYLALMVMSGSVSYACIRLITSTSGIPVFRTKLAVETLLFFANFAVQRDWVFLRKNNAAVIEAPPEPWSFQWSDLPFWLLLLIPVAIELLGFNEAGLLAGRIWEPAGAVRFALYVEFFLAVSLFFGLAARRYFVPVAVASVVLCSIYAVGILPVGAVLLFVFSATVCGRLFFGETIEGPLAFLAGTAFWIAVMYATLQLPVHYPVTHAAALILPLLIGFRSTRTLANQWLQVFRPAPSQPAFPEFAATAGLAFILIAHWLIVLKPDISADGLAMHLAIPANIARFHAFTVDFHKFIWALMPIGADLIYSLVYGIGGEYAARLANFAMLAAMAVLLVQTARSFVSKPVAILLTMLFVSTPLVYLTTGSLFIENFVAAMALGAVAALWRFQETRTTSYLMLTSVLLGAVMALKLGGVAIGLTGLAVLVFVLVRQKQRSLLRIASAVAVVLVLGSFPYVKAWWLSGNPFFPFQTGPFKSSFVANDIRDLQFRNIISWNFPYDLTFHTHRYFEGEHGSLGFQYLLFLPLIVATLLAVRSFKGRSAILIGLGAALAVTFTQPNARYFYFTLPLLTLGIAAALAWLHRRQTQVFRAAVVLAGAACFLNIWFLPIADWYHRDFFSAPLFTEAGRHDYLVKAPSGAEREVVSYINRSHPTEGVVLTDMDDSSIADVIAPVDTLNWHDYTFVKQEKNLTSPLDLYRFFHQRGIVNMVVDSSREQPQEALTSLIAACGQTEFRALPYVAMKLRADCEESLESWHPDWGTCSPNEPLPPGSWDDADPRIVYKGPWSNQARFARTWRNTISFSDKPGGLACLTIEGSGLRYVYTKAFNRGEAEISVDGEVKAVVDLYSPATEWQAQTTVSGLAPGRHDVSIRVMPRKNSAASDFNVDLDAIQVF